MIPSSNKKKWRMEGHKDNGRGRSSSGRRYGGLFLLLVFSWTKPWVQCLATESNSCSSCNCNKNNNRQNHDSILRMQRTQYSYSPQNSPLRKQRLHDVPLNKKDTNCRLFASRTDENESNSTGYLSGDSVSAGSFPGNHSESNSSNQMLSTESHIIASDHSPTSAVVVSSSIDGKNQSGTSQEPRIWPCGDKMDKELVEISLPVIGNYAIGPLIGAVDLFWVNRMMNALAVAGQSASNQVFSSAFWFVSFLPSVTATLVSKQHARGDEEGTQDAVCQALFVGFFIALIGTPLMFFCPDWALSAVLAPEAPAMKFARPYLLIRAFAFLPSLVSLVGFSAFRGILDTKTPVKISVFANVFNAVLDPIFIFTFSMGVPGAALATLAAEIVSAALYMRLLRKRNLILWRKLIKPPSMASLEPLLKGGLALQLRNLSLNLTFLAVARVTQSIDRSGVAAAAHAMAIQTFQIGGIVLLALSTVAQTVVPNAMVRRYDPQSMETAGGLKFAKATVNRLMSWGLILGCVLGSLQILLLPVIRRATPLQEVRDAAKIPAIIASALQVINGLVFIGEGVMIGTGSFLQLSLSTLVATLGCLWALWYFPSRIGLAGVWVGFGVFNIIRLIGVYIHQRINGPLSPTKMKLEEAFTGNPHLP